MATMATTLDCQLADAPGSQVSFPAMNLALAFAQSVQQRPEKVALYWGDTEVTYATLLAQSLAVARHLKEKFGVRPGDRVGLWLKNRPEFIPGLFGILSAGAVHVPINNFFKPAEVIHILNDAGVDVLISDEELGVHFPALASAHPSLKILKIETAVVEPAAAGSPTTGLPAPRSESDLAVIIYTSGTTGRPKGAMLSHGNLLHNVESCRQVLDTIEADRFAVLLPLFHSYMLTVGLFLPLLKGASIILIKSLNQPHHMLREMLQHQATVMPAIPPFYRTLTHANLPSLPFRLCVSGSAPLPMQVLKDFEAKFHIPLLEGYGLSEASPVVTKNPLHGVRKPGSIGLPLPRVEVSVQDDTGRMLATSEVGEICVRGGNVMMGYWNNPEETAKAMRGDWLLTGDIGYRDAEGYYFITDRKKDMLLVNGTNVYPREIEEVLHQFPGVKEVAVIGVPDPRKGEQPIAYVTPADGVTLDERALLQFVRRNLADYKVPKHIIFIPALPRNATGKILKTTLREQAANG
jgi:long-chain acyl-CoA synthetase